VAVKDKKNTFGQLVFTLSL